MSRGRRAAAFAIVIAAAVAVYWLGRSRPLPGEYVGLSAQRLPVRLTVSGDGKTLALDVSWCLEYCSPVERTVTRRSVRIAGDGSFSWSGRRGFVNSGYEESNRLRLNGRRDGDTLTGTWRVDRTGVDEEGDFDDSTGDVTFRVRRGGSVRQPAPRTDASGNLVIPLDGSPRLVAVGAKKAWVLGESSAARLTVTEFDPVTGRVDARIVLRKTSGFFRGATAGEGAVWLTGGLGPALARVDARTGRVRFISRQPMVSSGDGVAVGAGALWQVDVRPPGFSRLLLRADPRSGHTVRRIRIPPETPGPKCRRNVNAPPPPQLIAVGAGSVWVTSATDSFCGRLSQIDPRTNRVTRAIALQHAYYALVAAPGGVWGVTRRGSRYMRGRRVQYPAALQRIGLREGRPAAATLLPEGEVIGLAVSRDAVWLTQEVDGERHGALRRVDRVTGRLTTPLTFKGMPTNVAVGEGGVWVIDAVDRTLIRIPL